MIGDKIQDAMYCYERFIILSLTIFHLFRVIFRIQFSTLRKMVSYGANGNEAFLLLPHFLMFANFSIVWTSTKMVTLRPNVA